MAPFGSVMTSAQRPQPDLGNSPPSTAEVMDLIEVLAEAYVTSVSRKVAARFIEAAERVVAAREEAAGIVGIRAASPDPELTLLRLRTAARLHAIADKLRGRL